MMPRSSLLLGILLALPLAASIRSNVEREIAPREIDIASSDQSGSRIASDGNSFLTVWSDHNSAILGARLAPDGTLIDSTPLTIGAATGHEIHPAIAWGIDRYFVAWQESPNTFRGRLVAPDGTMSGILELGTRSTINVPEETYVAFNGRVFLVMFGDREIFRAVIVDTAGRITASRTIVTGYIASQANDLVAMEGTFYFVYEHDAVLALPIDEQAIAGMPIEIAHTSEAIGIRAAAREGDFLVAWWYPRQGANEVVAVRVTAEGPGAVDSFAEGRVVVQDVVADRTGYLVIYGDNTSVHARRAGGVTPFDVAIPAGSFIRADDSASNGARTITTIRRDGHLFASILIENRVTPVALAPRDQQAPDLAEAGELRLAVWREEATSDNETVLRAVRLDADGHPVDPNPIRLAAVVSPASPRVASNGTDWLVVWQYGGKLRGIRVRHDGSLVDAAPFIVGEIATPFDESIALAWDGTSYVVLYLSGGTIRNGISTALYAARVPASGTPTTVNPASAIRIAPSAWNWFPSIASGPNGSLIVWSEYDQLHGALLSKNDTVAPVSLLLGHGRKPVVAWNGHTFLVVAGTWQRELRVVRVDANGNASESTTRIPTTWEVYSAYMTIDVQPFGDAFLVYFADRDLMAAVVNRDGFLADGPAPVGKTLGGYVYSFGAAGPQFVTQHSIEHPTNPFRIFVQSLQWTLAITPKQRSVRF